MPRVVSPCIEVNTWLEENEKNGILRAYVAGAIHPAPRDVLMVGLASGSWAQVVAHLQLVLQAAAQHRGPYARVRSCCGGWSRPRSWRAGRVCAAQ